MDESSRGVMMSWEGPLMQAHAAAICQAGGDVLNVSHLLCKLGGRWWKTHGAYEPSCWVSLLLCYAVLSQFMALPSCAALTCISEAL